MADLIDKAGNLGNLGTYDAKMDATGTIILSASIAKDFGGASVENTLSIKASIFTIAENYVKSTGNTWDDALVSGLESILGIKKA